MNRVLANPAATADYCRQARRIRASFATQPLLRHYALTDLAKRHDASRPPSLQRSMKTPVRRIPTPVVVSAYLPSEWGTTTSAVERGFTEHAADRMRGGAFTFSDRAHLLDMAVKLGIPRFRANLILALERHRVDTGTRTPSITATRSTSWLAHILAIMVVEAIAIGMFVWICCP